MFPKVSMVIDCSLSSKWQAAIVRLAQTLEVCVTCFLPFLFMVWSLETHSSTPRTAPASDLKIAAEEKKMRWLMEKK